MSCRISAKLCPVFASRKRFASEFGKLSYARSLGKCLRLTPKWQICCYSGHYRHFIKYKVRCCKVLYHNVYFWLGLGRNKKSLHGYACDYAIKQPENLYILRILPILVVECFLCILGSRSSKSGDDSNKIGLLETCRLLQSLTNSTQSIQGGTNVTSRNHYSTTGNAARFSYGR